MYFSRDDLLQKETEMLAPYAIFNTNNGGRIYEEEEHSYRLPFQRDRDRILHSSAFKRLQYKTQVFIFSVGENYRNRMTHTLEVAGLSRTIASTLGLNSLLSESIALAHDLGHTPFGHAGQEILSGLMKDYGGFEHNKQSLRIVTSIEKKYPNFPGLNLCRETLKGLMKHGADYDSSVILLERKENGPSLEGMIADLSDEIAYTNHDIEDGWEMGYLHLGDLLENPFWKEVYEECKDQYKEVGEKILIRTSIRTLTNFLVSDLIQNIAHRLEKKQIKSTEDLALLWKQDFRIASFSKEVDLKFRELKSFLYEKLYRHEDLIRMSDYGKKIIESLFDYFLKHPEKIPDTYKERIEEESLYRVISDYVAGMTDRYAEKIYQSLP
ncbi:deoxyguanosinetriphosphate triphosphohydrolase [Leptospira interrogans]|uniref:Deoxyguanosinetriphosphate triphosphohydrolase-like protein n=1 Tax=Leptospira interrogans str. FPW1039 TaxID=1193040 RepID=A0A0F6IK61_LEPIR|nr:deoxyguanosinetriphosphate triphosphohydrolase [Leptospira interrogans]EMJ38436.1 phosphohydrolase-associated domain protein [Leptospira interrogans str. FPW1039]EMN96241.1 phosphohydrolase-associated domain protein [Leptospira interrogans serovar Medanensis str. UT053]KGE26950.1 deoxyguanosinetriphosphate triphosphohydrolase [Leptospira interrogans serovar Lai]MCH5432773.1 deoxyguanosinetriphosphate triphosphohydrolase [Leptospira interrogans serovar Canicola]MCR8627634.1 deoxyguanosinetri